VTPGHSLDDAARPLVVVRPVIVDTCRIIFGKMSTITLRGTVAAMRQWAAVRRCSENLAAMRQWAAAVMDRRRLKGK